MRWQLKAILKKISMNFIERLVFSTIVMLGGAMSGHKVIATSNLDIINLEEVLWPTGLEKEPKTRTLECAGRKVMTSVSWVLLDIKQE